LTCLFYRPASNPSCLLDINPSPPLQNDHPTVLANGSLSIFNQFLSHLSFSLDSPTPKKPPTPLLLPPPALFHFLSFPTRPVPRPLSCYRACCPTPDLGPPLLGCHCKTSHLPVPCRVWTTHPSGFAGFPRQVLRYFFCRFFLRFFHFFLMGRLFSIYLSPPATPPPAPHAPPHVHTPPATLGLRSKQNSRAYPPTQKDELPPITLDGSIVGPLSLGFA